MYGVKKDYDSAEKNYKKAIELNPNDGRNYEDYAILLNYIRKDNETAEINYKKAIEWWEKAAAQGHAYSQYNIGNMYYGGYGVKQNYKKAKELFGIACDGGFQSGCKNYKILNQQGY